MKPLRGMKPLVVIPTYLRKGPDVAMLVDTIRAAQKTAPGAIDILVVDDGSPDPDLVNQAEALGHDLGYAFHRKEDNTGFSATVNVGLKKALAEERDAVLLNADLEIDTPGWVESAQGTMDNYGNEAAVIGGLLLYPQTGLIQHAGIYFSLLTRRFGEMYKYGPGNLPAALKRKAIPVTGAFQYIRYECLRDVGLYDEDFKLGWEDVDYCIRVFLAEKQCVYNPEIRGWHFESMFRGEKTEKVARWEMQSFAHLAKKWADQSFADFVPFF